MHKDDRRFLNWFYEFTAEVVGLTLLGVWLDGEFGTSPRWVLVGLLLGFVTAGWSLWKILRALDDGDDGGNGA